MLFLSNLFTTSYNETVKLKKSNLLIHFSFMGLGRHFLVHGISKYVILAPFMLDIQVVCL